MSSSTASPRAPQASATRAPLDDRALVPRPWWRRTLQTRATAIFILDIMLVVVFSAMSGGLFLDLSNVQSLMLIGTEGLLLALGLAMLLGAGVFDLSLGANLVLSSIVGALVMKSIVGAPNTSDGYHNLPGGIAAAVVACVLAGMAFGLVNGLLIAILRINALIATLATLGIGTGVAYILSDGSDVSGLPAQIQTGFGLATLGPIPLPAVVALIVAGLLFLCVRFTRFGLRTLAIGSSRHSAERAGIRVAPHLIVLTLLAGALAGVAGFIDIARFDSSSINGHANDALSAVTAAVIGGTLLEGGKISVPGVVWGAALAVILQSGLVIVGVSSYYQLIAVGAVLVVAVGIDRFAYLRRHE